MSMYVQILEAALGERPCLEGVTTTDRALRELRRRSRQLGSVAPVPPGSDWTSAALANQIAYDLALIDFVRSLDIDCEPGAFDQPERQRDELWHALKSRGINWEELDN